MIVGTPLAYLLARRDFPGKSSSTVLLDLPIVLPPTVAGVALLVTLGRRGVVGQHLDTSISRSRRTAVVLAQLFVSAPFYIRTAQGRLRGGGTAARGRRLDARLVRAANVPACDAAARLAVDRRRRVLCWARALSELGATLIFAGNYQGRTQTMPLAIISAFESGRSIDVPIALSVILVAAAAVLLLLLRVLARSAPSNLMLQHRS